MSLDDLRREINELDERLLELLNQRARVALEIGKQKQAQGSDVYDPGREAQVFRRLTDAQKKAQGEFPVSATEAVFREIMSACRTLQVPVTVAFLGPQGTFTHQAAQQTFGSGAEYHAETTIENVFEAVARRVVQVGVVPIENSTGGGVTTTADCLINYDLSIKGEIVVDAAHCLLAQHDDLAQIERVYSHPQGLLQCRNWLARNLPQAKLVETSSTSYAAKQAAADPKVASVSSRLAAEVHKLRVVRENIQDRVKNQTRFVVLAPEDASRTGDDMTSIVFSTPHERGALQRALAIFDQEGINLMRIESRPFGSEMWEYAFFTDLLGHREDEPVKKALQRLASHCGHVKLLGSYPRSRAAR